MHHFVVKPLSQAFLKDIPVNDSFKELFNKNSMHDINLFFERDKVVIPAHKIVLFTSEWLRDRIEKQQYYKDANGM
jgi:hypothetical protein